jgi:ribosomal peptide maturation radical SAM protein 1
MPWMALALPSIQLATLAAALRQEEINCVSYELYLDYGASIGTNLYNILSNSGGFIEEWLFARHYYKAEIGDDLARFRAYRPRFGLESVELEDQCLDALESVTEDFLEELAERPVWANHDIIGFSLTISQTASSMALARLLKRRYPKLFIVCGGSACASPMGLALMKICPYIDAVVTTEGEAILPELVRCARNGKALDRLPGVLRRDPSNGFVGKPGGPVLTKRVATSIQFDEYFSRLNDLGLDDRIEPWLPFESSRGCWWGEKIQCTFCGLHEIMQYRNWSWDATLEQLEMMYERYGISRFFAVDLIMPSEYLKTLLPEIIRRGYNWSLFYEIKANLKRSDIETLATAGVRWIQPGIESLDDSILKLMNKGVTALQNIQVLKWCCEMGVHVTWNIITEIPGEDPEVYTSIADLIPSLFHLPPSSGGGPFQLHRFSPYFKDPERYHITWLGAHPLYQYIFPVDRSILDDLVYLHGYSVARTQPPEDYLQPLYKAISDWQTAYSRGASLKYSIGPDRGGIILDSRTLPEHRHSLTSSEATLYRFLDSARSERSLKSEFTLAYPREAEDLLNSGGVDMRLETWEKLRLVIRDRDRVLALAISEPVSTIAQASQTYKFQAPVPYLGDFAS